MPKKRFQDLAKRLLKGLVGALLWLISPITTYCSMLRQEAYAKKIFKRDKKLAEQTATERLDRDNWSDYKLELVQLSRRLVVWHWQVAPGDIIIGALSVVGAFALSDLGFSVRSIRNETLEAVIVGGFIIVEIAAIIFGGSKIGNGYRLLIDSLPYAQMVHSVMLQTPNDLRSEDLDYATKEYLEKLLNPYALYSWSYDHRPNLNQMMLRKIKKD